MKFNSSFVGFSIAIIALRGTVQHLYFSKNFWGPVDGESANSLAMRKSGSEDFLLNAHGTTRPPLGGGKAPPSFSKAPPRKILGGA